MEALGERRCNGCLSCERKLMTLDDAQRQYFLENILELSCLDYKDVAVLLCWECVATVKRLTNFKTRVKQIHKMLQSHYHQVLDTKLMTSLCIYKVYNIDIRPKDENSETNNHGIKYEIVKTEGNDFDHVEVKQELLEDMRACSDEDDQFLIELKTAKKKKENRVKKKRKLKDVATLPQPGAEYRVVQLSEAEVEDERQRRARAELYDGAEHRCERCVLAFANRDDLRDHIRLKHDAAGDARCGVCGRGFVSRLALNYHRGKHFRRYECVAASCGHRADSESAARRHYRQEHTVTSVTSVLPVSPELTRTDSKAEEDSKVDDNTESTPTEEATTLYPCSLCQKTFRWKTSLRKHAETHRIERGETRRPHCDTCGLSFSSRANLQKHVKTSTKHQIQLKIRKLKPTLQSEEGEREEVESIKKEVAEARQRYTCTECGRRFQWRGNLTRHLHTHRDRARGVLVCVPCGRSFSSRATYSQHMNTSLKHVKPDHFKHMCSECGARFPTLCKLRDHTAWAHAPPSAARPHRCTVCGRACPSRAALYLHTRAVHTKHVVRQLCDHCGRHFPTRAKLLSHQWSAHGSAHPPRPPLSCPAAGCGRHFAWRSCLSRHVRRAHRTPSAQTDSAAPHAAR